MRRAAGFTLLELLVVLAIMALIAAVALPDLRLPGFATDAARAARRIATGLADARQQAIRTNRESVVVFDLEQRSFQATDGSEVALSGIDRLTLLTAERDLIDRTRGQIRFYPDGSSDGGEVGIRDAGGGSTTVRINWLTGRISHDG